MKRNWIPLIVVCLVCLGICIASLACIRSIVDEMDKKRMGVMELLEANDAEGAFQALSEMALFWKKYESRLESIAFHEALHDITVYLVEADANLQIGDKDDFYRSMALMGEALSHLYEEERLRLSNIL